MPHILHFVIAATTALAAFLPAAAMLVAGYAFLTVLGVAGMVLLLPARWLRYRLLVAPHAGWAVLVALGYPLNAALPFRWVAPLLLAAALGVLAVDGTRRPRRWRRWLGGRSAWREAAAPTLLGLVTYVGTSAVYLRQGALSALVVDSDVEHFADVIASMVYFPIGWSATAQQGLEATPVGLAYHYVHASLSAVTGMDAFRTAMPSHLLMLALATQSVYLFARAAGGLSRRAATLATALYALCGLPLVVAGFGWGQQTAALATVPFGLAALSLALVERDRRSLWLAGLAGALAAGSLYLATAPLVGGAAAALALIAAVRAARRAPAGHAWTAAVRPLRRLTAIGGVVLAAGALSHLSAAAFLLSRAQAGFLAADDLSGRSTHVSTFASAATALGVAPLDLVRDASTNDHQTLLRWWPDTVPAAATLQGAALAGGAGLVALGGLHLAPRRPAVMGSLAVALLYDLYLRAWRPFPYGEFKLLTSVWFLFPCLAAAGWEWLSRWAKQSKRARPTRWARPAAGGLVAATYAGGLALALAHDVQFLSLPWGAALPDAAMADARAVVRAVPRGASVFVSDQLTPAAAYQWSGAGPDGQPSPSRAGFPSRAARANYLGRRWRGVVTHLLAYGGRPVYGLVQRYSTELRLPVSAGATDYVILDAAEDPRLNGLLPSDLALAAGTLRLYRQAGRPVAAAAALAVPSTGAAAAIADVQAGRDFVETWPGTSLAQRARAGEATLPPPVLPVGESLPGRRRPLPAPVSPPPAAGAAAAGGNLVIGLQAVETVLVNVTVQDADGTSARSLLVEPGLTWYTTPAVRWPAAAQLRVTGVTGVTGPPSLPNAAIVPVSVFPVAAAGAPMPEALERSDAGSRWPLLTVAAYQAGNGGILVHAWYSYVGPAAASWIGQVKESDRLWIGGAAAPLGLSDVTGSRSWWSEVRPGEAPDQADGAPGAAGRWLTETGERWLWLSLGPDHEPSLHDPALLAVQVGDGQARLEQPLLTSAVLPLLGAAAPLPNVDDETLVKGTGDNLFLVEHGRRRWVPSTTVLEQRHIPWRLTVLDDASLWRLPVGLPLS